MKVEVELREAVRVAMHLNGGYTQVRLERVPACTWDIPTRAIPFDLRDLGSRFVVVVPSLIPEDGDSAEQLRAAMAEISIEPIG